MAELVEIILSLRGGRAFAGQMDKSAKGVKKVGDNTEKAGRQSKIAGKQMAGLAANSAAVYGAGRFLKSAATATTDLAKSTMALSRSTGMSTETASAWSSMLKTRDIDAKQFNVGMVKLSKSMVKGSGDAKAYADTFGKLGISQETIRAGDTNSVLMQSADAFAKMTNPAEKAAMAQQLFGKQGQNLLPIFASGSAGIKEQLGLAEKYGATIKGKTSEDVKELIAKQRELKFAQEGVKVQLGTSLLPVMTQFGLIVSGIAAKLAPVLKNSAALRIIILTLATAFLGAKAASVALTLSQLGLNAAFIKTAATTVANTAATVAHKIVMVATSAATKAWAAAQWLLNAALTANPIGLVIVAIVAMGAALVLAYKKVGWFRDAVNAAFHWVKNAAQEVFGWIKRNWPLLASILGGPFVAVGIAIARNFDGIKETVKGALNWIIDRWNNLSFGMDAVKVAGKTVVPGFHVNTPDVPRLATGGTITRGGSAIVGERGPEMVRLPRAAEVVPLGGGAGALDSRGQTIVTQVFLDRRQIAEAVGTYTADRLARR